jgi:hypothetical protein
MSKRKPFGFVIFVFCIDSYAAKFWAIGMMLLLIYGVWDLYTNLKQEESDLEFKKRS